MLSAKLCHRAYAWNEENDFFYLEKLTEEKSDYIFMAIILSFFFNISISRELETFVKNFMTKVLYVFVVLYVSFLVISGKIDGENSFRYNFVNSKILRNNFI